MSRCAPVNRLVMLRARGLAGPFFQNVGGGRCMHSAGNFIGSVGPSVQVKSSIPPLPTSESKTRRE